MRLKRMVLWLARREGVLSYQILNLEKATSDMQFTYLTEELSRTLNYSRQLCVVCMGQIPCSTLDVA